MSVRITIDPACIEAENVSEFYPEAHKALVGALRDMLPRDSRDHRDADIIASIGLSRALKALLSSCDGQARR